MKPIPKDPAWIDPKDPKYKGLKEGKPKPGVKRRMSEEEYWGLVRQVRRQGPPPSK